jgi:hypothetical protein
MNILDTIKNKALQGALTLAEAFFPQIKPLVDAIQADVAEGKVTVENFLTTFDAGISTAEGFTNDKWDAALEAYRKIVHDIFDAITLTEEALK